MIKHTSEEYELYLHDSWMGPDRRDIPMWYVMRIIGNRCDLKILPMLRNTLGQENVVYPMKTFTDRAENGRIRKKELALIPGIVFCRASEIDLIAIHRDEPRFTFRIYPKVMLSQPRPIVNDDEMDTFIKACADPNYTVTLLTIDEAREQTRSGKKVKIKGGILNNIEGLKSDRRTNGNRVILTVGNYFAFNIKVNKNHD